MQSFKELIFQLTSGVSDYHEKISLHVSLRMILKLSQAFRREPCNDT